MNRLWILIDILFFVDAVILALIVLSAVVRWLYVICI